MAVTANKTTGPIGVSSRSGESFAYTTGSKEIKQGWIVGIALDGSDKGLIVPVPEPGAETKPAVRVVGIAEHDSLPGDMINVLATCLLLPLAAGEKAEDASLYIGAAAKAMDHSTVTVAGATAKMATVGIIREIDSSLEWIWVDIRLANLGQ